MVKRGSLQVPVPKTKELGMLHYTAVWVPAPQCCCTSAMGKRFKIQRKEVKEIIEGEQKMMLDKSIGISLMQFS